MCRLAGASNNTSNFFGLNGRHLPLKNEIWMLRSQKIFAAYNTTGVEKRHQRAAEIWIIVEPERQNSSSVKTSTTNVISKKLFNFH